MIAVMIGGMVADILTNNPVWIFLAIGTALLFISKHFWPVSLGIAGVVLTGNIRFLVTGIAVATAMFILRNLVPHVSWRFLAHYVLALLYCSRQKWSNALAQTDKALRFAPNSVAALSKRAMIYWYQDRMTDMEVDARQLVKVKPQNWFAHRLLGVSLCCQMRNQEALASFKRSLELVPEIRPRRGIGAWIARHCEMPIKAHILSDIGNVYYRLSDFATALQYYKEALAAQSNTNIRRESLFYLGKCYEALGCHEDAQDAFAHLPAERAGLKRLLRQAQFWPITNAACLEAKHDLEEIEHLIDVYSR